MQNLYSSLSKNMPFSFSPLPPKQKLLTYEILIQAVKVAKEQDNNRSIAYAKSYLTELYAAEQRYDDAIQLTQQAIFHAQIYPEFHNYPELLSRLYWQLGKIFKAQNNSTKALLAYQSAVEYLQKTHKYRNLSKSFRDMEEKVYFELVDLQLQKTARMQAGNEKQSLLEVVLNNIIEPLKKVEIQNYFKDECVTTIGKHKTVAEVKQFLLSRPKTVIFYPLLFKDRFELLLVSGNGEIKQETQIPEECIEGECIEKVKEMINSVSLRLSAPAGNCISDKQKSKIYGWFRKIFDKLEENTTLIIVPHEKLYAIPFAALYDKKDNQFLIEKYPLIITPSIKLTDSRQATLQQSDGHILINGLSANVGGFPALCGMPSEILNTSCLLGDNPKAIEENAFEDCLKIRIEACQNRTHSTKANKTLMQCLKEKGIECHLSENVDILQDQDFTLSNVEEVLINQKIPYSTVHFGTHGVFRGEPNKTYLQTYDKKITMDKLRELIQNNQSFGNQPSDLLTLSACATAVGDERAAFGLASVAIKANVPNVVASLWNVNDKASTELMKLFYMNLVGSSCSESKCTKAEALQKAQIKLLRKGFENVKLQCDEGGKQSIPPYYWAPFLLIGNGL
ncbi:Tetratricopeptide repeat protein [Beggiatoa sp. PS]|nr:Tetratricopeptide repeat protein [Beggiatoa sp. PS]